MLNIIFQIACLLIIVFLLFITVKDKKLAKRRKEEIDNMITKKDKRVVYVITLSTIVGYYILSYLLD